MDLQDRIIRLQHAADDDGTTIENELRFDSVLAVTKNGTATPGTTDTWVVMFETGRREAIFKKLGNVKHSTASIYKQDPVEANVHEVVAWRLARAMGDPWEQLVPTAVLRALDEGRGVLMNRRFGDRDSAAMFQYAAGQAAAAAFWDSLIGQQDRHAGQYKYDSASNRLALIDHAFAFALPGHTCNESMFVKARKQQHHDRLQDNEVDALDGLLANDLHGLRGFLSEPRAEALHARAVKMRKNGRVLLPGDF